MKYFDMPINEKRLVLSQWDHVGVTHRNKKIRIEREPAFFWGKVTLVNACMSSITLYM
jgi:hypothetical protein